MYLFLKNVSKTGRTKYDLLVGWGEERLNQSKTTGDGGGHGMAPENNIG